MIDIDLVYLWVNGNDPKWIAKRNACIGDTTTKAENCKGRYADNDELKYSLRSIDRYAPWIRKIFIVTDEQVPEWLDTSNPKIQIVDHKDILPAECLPCFNSMVIEHHLHCIDGLSEHFLYANDDMFINRPVSPSDFFKNEMFPIVRLNYRLLRKPYIWFKTHVLGRRLNMYSTTINNAAKLTEKVFGTYYNGRTHHNIDAYLKSNYNLARNIFGKEIDRTLTNHMRSNTDIQRNIYSYVLLATKCGHLRYVSRRTSFRFHIDNHTHYKKLLKANPMLFCMNDSQYSNDMDRITAKEFLSGYFPEKSQFEK